MTDLHASAASSDTLEVRFVAADGPEVHPLLADLEREYDSRYSDLLPEPASVELARYAPELFAPPLGAFVVLLQGGEAVAGGAAVPVAGGAAVPVAGGAAVPVAGGAFMPYVEHTPDGDVEHPDTVEIKRVWTSAAHRGRGLARRVLAELEDEAARRGIARIYLTTGPRQPEAVRLYTAAGYTPLFDTSASPEEVGIHPFAKFLRP